MNIYSEVINLFEIRFLSNVQCLPNYVGFFLSDIIYMNDQIETSQ